MAETAEKLTLDLAQTVVIGRFNPYIVSPRWLAEQGVVTDADDDLFDFDDLLEDEATFAAGGFEWEVSLRRLAITVGKPGQDCGAKAAAVLAVLDHTPVDAVGNNFTFVCPANVWGGRPTPRLGPNERPGGATESRWTGQFDRANGARTELELLFVPGTLAVLRLNYDRRVSTAAEARAVAGRFADDYADARELIQTLFRIDLP